MNTTILLLILFGLYWFGAGATFAFILGEDRKSGIRLPYSILVFLSVFWLACSLALGLVLLIEKLSEWYGVIRDYEEESAYRYCVDRVRNGVEE